jgi:hypothetical protein
VLSIGKGSSHGYLMCAGIELYGVFTPAWEGGEV